MSQLPTSLRFPQGLFAELREHLLNDLDQEHFALLLGQRELVGELTIIKIVTVRYPTTEDYMSQGRAHLRLKREYIYRVLLEMQQRGDVDTLIDVHTHPFSAHSVAFSGVDDHDEIAFHRWLMKTLDNVNYASIVLSQSDYSARHWMQHGKRSIARPARIKTQTVAERWPCANDAAASQADVLTAADPQQGFLARSALALGLDTLRQVMHDQTIAVVGVGGLGSVIAENLIHTGFHNVHLIDHDHVEVTNLNRIVGAYYSDAAQKRLKVDVVRDHLLRINPKAHVQAHAVGVEDDSVIGVLAQADWIMVGTDSHFSRFIAQHIALQYAVPLISVGANITVENGQITDMSGEIIIIRYGDDLCLHCLKRINPTIIAAEQHQGQFLGNELIRRGYVAGQEVKEPAVKTLNAILGAMAVDGLLNQFTQRQEHVPVIVYENNGMACIYPDRESVSMRNKECYVCSTSALRN
jgi:molybdopterin-synthase adenylyltransferase